MEKIKKYHLYKDDYSKLHFQVHDAEAYCDKNETHCYKPHQHSFYQFIWFQSSGQHFVDYEVITHEANTLFFLDKGQVHNFCSNSANTGVLFHFDDAFLNQQDQEADNWLQYKIFNGMGSPHIHLPELTVALFEKTVPTLEEEMKNQEHNYAKQVFHLFQVLILAVERLKHSQTGLSYTKDKDYRLAIQFKKSIHANMHSLLNVDQYSEKLGVSKKKLTEISKTYLDDTPLNIIHKRKVLEAKRLLSNTNISIKELAYKLGFDQPTYFTKYFKKHTGFTPKEFSSQLL